MPEVDVVDKAVNRLRGNILQIIESKVDYIDNYDELKYAPSKKIYVIMNDLREEIKEKGVK